MTSRTSSPISISPTRYWRRTRDSSRLLGRVRSSIERMFVLGIDPGLTRCGYGLVEGSFEGVESFRAVRAGTIQTDHEVAVEQRLGQMLIELRTLIAETAP